jgi:uncharacterized protein YjbI with pentapeptide repeats
MRRLFAGVIAAVVLAAAIPAWACSCPYRDSDDALRRSTVIIRGTAIGEECAADKEQDCAHLAPVRFRVVGTIKGRPGRDEVLVRIPREAPGNCGMTVVPGKEYVVVVMGDAAQGHRAERCQIQSAEGRSDTFDIHQYRVEELRRRLAAAPTDSTARQAVFDLYVRSEDWENLRDLLVETESPEELELLGQAEQHLSHGEAALAAFERALARDPNRSAARRGRTTALILLGRTRDLGENSDFTGIIAPRLTLSGRTLAHAAFARGEFQDLDIAGAQVDGADLRHARIDLITGTTARLRQADFRHAVLRGGSLARADLHSANFQWARLEQVSFVGTDLTNANFTAANLQAVDFTGAKLAGADFTGAQLTGCKLTGADLSGQNLSGVALHGADLTDAKLVNADIAVALARQGHRVTLSTTDPAAHVAAAVDGEVPGLTVTRIDPDREVATYRDEVLAKAGANLDAAGRAMLEEDLRSPCTEEIAVFRAFACTVDQARNQFVVLDTAPTGHTILLLDAAEAYHREVLRTQADMPEAVRALLPRLRDPEFTRPIIVTLAEATPVHEAERLPQDLARAGITPYAWIINQSILASGTTDPLLTQRGSHEIPFIEQVVTQLARRTALIPWQP